MAQEDGPGFLFHRHVGVGGGVGEGDREGGNKMRVEEGKDPVGDFVDGEMLADISLRGLPHEGAFGGVELGEEGAVTLGGPEGRLVGDRLMEPSGGRVDLRGGGGEPKGSHSLTMFYQERKGREAGLDGQHGDRSRGKAIGDPSVYAPPEGVESVLHLYEGGEQVGTV